MFHLWNFQYIKIYSSRKCSVLRCLCFHIFLFLYLNYKLIGSTLIAKIQIPGKIVKVRVNGGVNMSTLDAALGSQASIFIILFDENVLGNLVLREDWPPSVNCILRYGIQIFQLKKKCICLLADAKQIDWNAQRGGGVQIKAPKNLARVQNVYI